MLGTVESWVLLLLCFLLVAFWLMGTVLALAHHSSTVCLHRPLHYLLETLRKVVFEVAGCLGLVLLPCSVCFLIHAGVRCRLKKCAIWVSTHSRHQMDTPVWDRCQPALCLILLRMICCLLCYSHATDSRPEPWTPCPLPHLLSCHCPYALPLHPLLSAHLSANSPTTSSSSSLLVPWWWWWWAVDVGGGGVIIIVAGGGGWS